MTIARAEAMAELTDDDVADLVAWGRLPSLVRGEVDPEAPREAVPPLAASGSGATGVRSVGRSTEPTLADQSRERLERETISEIQQLVRKSTRARDAETWFARVNPLTERKEVKWSTVLPLVVVLAIVFYAALRLNASPGRADARKATDTAARDALARGSDGEPTVAEEALFSPRSQYSVTGARETPAPVEAPPQAAATAPAQPPAPPKPSPPASWQAGLSMSLPADEEYADEPLDEPGPSQLVLLEGTRIPAVLVGTLASSFESPVQARLDGPFLHEGVTVLPEGTLLLGTSQPNSTQRRIYVRFHRAILPSGHTFEVRAAAQNSDFSTGLTADRVEKHRKRNLVAGTVAGIASRAGSLFGIRGPGSQELGAAGRAAQAQVVGEARSAMSDVTLFVNAGRRVFAYLEADATL